MNIHQKAGDNAKQIGNIGSARDIYMGSSRPQTGVPFQAPPLPQYFVERPEVTTELKQLLLAPETAQAGTLVVSAIYGLGGIGKSVLASALAYDEEVQKHFSDGVLWATLGQQADILSFLFTWIQALGDYDFKPTTPEAASLHLRTLLSDKTILLVVDDVWNAEDVTPFQIGGAGCRVLVTTREAPIKGAVRYDLDVMTEPQALKLLTNAWQSQPTEAEITIPQQLAKTLGYLPLALELAAAQINDDISIDELLADLQAEIAYLESLDSPTAEDIQDEKEQKKYSLIASFNLSLKRLSAEKLKQFAWLGVLPEDAPITKGMAATLWNLRERKARDTLRYLKAKSLLLPGKLSEETYRLHDLLHDLARNLLTSPNKPESEQLSGLGLTLESAHQTLLQRYQAQTKDSLWASLPDDGYIHNYLTWHLEKAGWGEEIHKLLKEETEKGENAWYVACERLGKTGYFVNDLAKAWQLAKEAFSANPSRAIGLQCRYLLITSSLNSLAANIPAELMAALVEKKLWTPAQALAYACQIKDSQKQAEALTKLAPHLPETLWPEALAAARSIQSEDKRAKAFSTLLSELNPSSVNYSLWKECLEILATNNRKVVLKNISQLSPIIMALGGKEALAEIALAIQDVGRWWK